jgi:hypothetical protein
VLYNHRVTAPQQLRYHCRNPRCGGNLKITADNPRDAFCCRGCDEQFYNRRCRVCSQLFARKTVRRVICGRSRCRHEWQRHREFYGLRLDHNRPKTAPGYITAPVGHNASRNPIKPGIKTGLKSGRAWRHVAGPEGHEINYRIPLDPQALKASQAFREYIKCESTKAIFQRNTPPLNVIGGYRFSGAPHTDLSPMPVAAPRAPRGPPIGDGLNIPAFLDRTLWNRGAP